MRKIRMVVGAIVVLAASCRTPTEPRTLERLPAQPAHEGCPTGHWVVRGGIVPDSTWVCD